jgi:hypothetical protein
MNGRIRTTGWLGQIIRRSGDDDIRKALVHDLPAVFSAS